VVVKEHPILFSGPMVRAILDGSKTQTRRIVKDAPGDADSTMRQVAAMTCIDAEPGTVFWRFGIPGGITKGFRCPYGQPGGRLWVRESCIISSKNFGDRHFSNATDYEGDWRTIQYLADGFDRDAANDFGFTKATPSIHMPRWASRITLEVTDVRVERVQEISKADALAEGMLPNEDPASGHIHPASQFAQLWDGINAKRAPWSANPWVWVIGFRRMQP
jgi:hypothetical protein